MKIDSANEIAARGQPGQKPNVAQQLEINTENNIVIEADRRNFTLIKEVEKEIRSDEETKKSKKDLEDGIIKLNQTTRIFNRSIHFKIHEGSKRWLVQIINTDTDEVISEIPPEKVLDMVARLDQLVGLLVDERR